jgi:hypothetical protein
MQAIRANEDAIHCPMRYFSSALIASQHSIELHEAIREKAIWRWVKAGIADP